MRRVFLAVAGAVALWSTSHATGYMDLIKDNPENDDMYDRIAACTELGYSITWEGVEQLPTHLLGAVNAIDTAFDQWENIVTHVSITFGGSSESVLDLDDWPFDDEFFGTTGFARTSNGIIGFAMRFNMDRANVYRAADLWTISNPASSWGIHLPTVALHEAGHVMGLDLGQQNEYSYSSSNTVMAGYVTGTTGAIRDWDRLAMAQIYGNDVCSSGIPIHWGEFKGLYAGYTVFDGAIALSGIDNTIAWNHLPGDSTRTYFVYRSEDGDEPVTLVGMTFADSVFVDDDVEFGKEYRYHVASADSTTLLDIGLGNAGLKQVSSKLLSTELSDLNYAQALVVHGNKLFASSLDRIARINISDPANPVITASRTTDVFDDGVRLMALSSDATKLYVVTYSGFVVLDATSPGLAVLGALWNLTPDCCADGDFIVDMRVDGDIVYLAGGNNGLLAIDVWNPTNPQIAGVHPTGLETSWAVRVELVGEYLYLAISDWTSVPGRHERLVATKTLSQQFGHHWDVDFEVDCSSANGCLDSDFWLSGHGGSAKGVLGVGVGNGWLGVNLAQPTKPERMRELKSPVSRPSYAITDSFGTPVDTVTFMPSILSYDTDSRYIYATTPVWGDKLDRSLVAFDAWAEGPNALFAAGDTLGSNLGGIVRSQGKYLYVLDDFKARGGAPAATRLRVFEKANGCKPDPVHPVRLFPERSAFKLGEEVAAVWAIGCPISVTVDIVEDGSPVESVDSQTYTIADDVANSTSWVVSAPSSDLENHAYQFRVTATYETGPPATFYSAPFAIEIGNTLRVATNGSQPYTSIQAAINASTSGDTVLVYQGDYDEHLVLRSNLKIVGKPGARIIPSTSGPAVVANGFVHPPTVDGLEFRFTNGISETALDVDDCGIQVRSSTFASLERAVEVSNGFGTFTNCTFEDNNDPSVGGAIWINSAASGQTTFTDCTFEGNTAGNYGAAVWISSEGSYNTMAPQIEFVRCSFTGNAATSFATVRVGDYTRPRFDRCVFAGNEVSASGAVVGGTGAASASFTNCTFADNTSAAAFDVLSLPPLTGAPPLTVDACVFANNSNARAISSTHGGSYVVSNSDFFGNTSGDVQAAESGTGNFSENPAFCGAGVYTIQAFSPCVPGVTVSTLVGALDVDCVPDAEITVVTIVPGRLLGCPQGDADSLVVEIDFDNSTMTRTVNLDELTLAQPYKEKGIWSLTPLAPIGSASQPEFTTVFRHRNVSGYRAVADPAMTGFDSLTVLLNNHPLAERAIVPRRGFDLSGDGRVNVVDFSKFASAFPTGPTKPYKEWANFSGTTPMIDLQDFGAFGIHLNHQHATLPPDFAPLSAEESPAVVSLRFEEEDPIDGGHRMRAFVSLENAGLYQATLISLSNDNPKFRFVQWHPRADYPQVTMATDLVRDGQKLIMIGALGNKHVDASRVELGYFETEVLSDAQFEPGSSDFQLIAAEVLSMENVPQGVPQGNSRRSYSEPTYRNELRQNYPNPFNPTTTIAFSLGKASRAEVKIFDVRGALVKTLMNDRRQKGNHRLVWTGDNNQGNQVASGVYFYRLTAGQFRATKKMVLVR